MTEYAFASKGCPKENYSIDNSNKGCYNLREYMFELQPVEPDPEPLGAHSFELYEKNDDETAEMNSLMLSIEEAVIGIIKRDDDAKRNTFVFREEKTLPFPAGELSAFPEGGRARLHHYTLYGSPTTSSFPTPAEELFDAQYKKRHVGIDVLLPVGRNGAKGDRFVSIKRYRIEEADDTTLALRRLIYKKDLEVPRDVDEQTIADLCSLLQLLRGNGEVAPKLES